MSAADQVRAFFTRYSIARSRALFQIDPNPFHAWAAYRWARHNDEPIPDWVLDYFDRCAEQLDQAKPTKPKTIAAAFGMAPQGGGPSLSSRAASASDRLKAAQMVWALQQKCPKVADKEIFADVAAWLGKSDRYVEEGYYEFFPRN